MRVAKQGLAAPDGIIELRRDSNLVRNQRRVSYLGRDWPDLEEEAIELDPETLPFSVVGAASAMAEERQKRSHEKEADDLLRLLPSGPPGMSLSELTEKAGL